MFSGQEVLSGRRTLRFKRTRRLSLNVRLGADRTRRFRRIRRLSLKNRRRADKPLKRFRNRKRILSAFRPRIRIPFRGGNCLRNTRRRRPQAASVRESCRAFRRADSDRIRSRREARLQAPLRAEEPRSFRIPQGNRKRSGQFRLKRAENVEEEKKKGGNPAFFFLPSVSEISPRGKTFGHNSVERL